MQELIEFIDDKFIVSNSTQISSIYHKAQELLKKEKEQITKAYNSAIPFKFGEQYYNEKYNQKEETLEEWKSKFTHHCAIKDNQKQHIIDIMKADEDDGLYDLNK